MQRVVSRRETGQGVFALSALVGLIIIPLIGIFAFEIARYQHGVNQLEANCDSAALAGAAMLVTSRYQRQQDRVLRFNEATKAAENAFKSTFSQTNSQLNDVLGSTLRTATNVGRQGALTMGSQPGDCTYKVEAVDPANFQVVDPTSDRAKAVRVSALFTARPAFSKFLGLGSMVPISSRASAGVPVLDVVVCFDVSGSMDDSTRVSLVNRKFTIPEPERTQIGTAYQNYINAKTTLDNYKAGVNSAGYNKGYCDGLYNNALNLWNIYVNLRQNSAGQKGKVEYGQVQVGTLADCLFNPLSPDGLAVNTQYPQNLNLVNWQKFFKPPANPQLPTFNFVERNFQENGGPNPFADPNNFGCGSPLGPGYPSNYACSCPNAPDGFTDIIVKLDNQINVSKNQPIFGFADPLQPYPGPGPGKFTYIKKRQPYKGQSYTFDGIGYLVEAQRGNLEQQRFLSLKNNLFKNNIAIGELPQQGKDGYQAAYFEMASYYSQPIASTVDALENFYLALNGAGSDVHFGLVAFETFAAAGSPSTTNVQIPDIAYQQLGCCSADINTSSANYPNTPRGPKKYPILRMDLQTLTDPESTLLPDPTDGSKPNLTMNDIFENYLVPLRATNVAAALDDAMVMLGNSPRKAFARQVIILITDGVATRDRNGVANSALGVQQARQDATQANTAGLPIFTIGVGQNQAVQNLMVPFLGDNFATPPAPQGLAQLSGNGARFFPVNKNSIIAPGGGQVNAISQAFLQVARSLVQLVE